MRVPALIVAICVLALTACTATVAGVGHTATPPSPTSTTPRSALGAECPSYYVTAQDAPFCYPLPTAQFQVWDGNNDYGNGWTYRTMVLIELNDNIEVLASRAPTDQDRLSDAQLSLFYELSNRVLNPQPGVTYGRVIRTHVAGSRAFEQTVKYGDGISVDTTTVFRGFVVVRISCMGQLHPVDMQAACVAVKDDIKIGL